MSSTAAAAPAVTAPVGWDDLPTLNAQEVALRNANLMQLAPWVFAVAGVPVRFAWAPFAEQDAAAASAWLWLSWSGLPVVAAVSPGLADAVAQSVAEVAVDQLGESGIDLFAQLMLAPRLPAGLTLRQAALSREGLPAVPQWLEPLGTWRGHHPGSGEPSGHGVSLWAGPGFPLAAMLGSVASLASSRRRSPLAALPIALPLIAARWCVDADQLQDLAVGDVLVVG